MISGLGTELNVMRKNDEIAGRGISFRFILLFVMILASSILKGQAPVKDNEQIRDAPFMTAGPLEDEPSDHEPDTIARSDVPILEILIRIYPNPFTSSTSIEFGSNVNRPDLTVEIFSLMGVRIASLYHGPVYANISYTLTYKSQPEDASAIYQVLLKSGAERIVKRIMLIK